jgi:hypothetical protein
MPTNREFAAAFGVISVAWVLLGFTIGFFVSMPASDIWMNFIVTLLVLIFTPAVMLKARWTVLGAVIVGVTRIVLEIAGLIMLPSSLVYGPVVALVVALLFTYFSYRAYKQK